MFGQSGGGETPRESCESVSLNLVSKVGILAPLQAPSCVGGLLTMATIGTP